MNFDLQRARRETPGCENVVHFNNAGAALMPERVVDAVVEYLQLEAQIGGYEAAESKQADVERAYSAIANMLSCSPSEVAIIENATRAWDMAFYSLDFQSGDRILTAKAEYASNYIAFLQIARRTGAKIEVIPNDELGQLSLSALENAIDEKVKLIAITHVPTNGGLVNPAVAVGKIARKAGVLYLLDACQSVGQMPVDVKTIGCDILSATGRKFLRAPRGTGFLYIRQDLIEQLEPPFLDLHAAEWTSTNDYQIRTDARRFENWETNYAGKVGLGVAVDYALQWGLDRIQNRISILAQQLRDRLAAISNVTVQDLGKQRCGIVSFTIAGKNSLEIKQALAKSKINVSVSPLKYTRLDMEDRGQQDFIRASVHYYNSEEEVDYFCKTLVSLLV